MLIKLLTMHVTFQVAMGSIMLLIKHGMQRKMRLMQRMRYLNNNKSSTQFYVIYIYIWTIDMDYGQL
jgi:hypothetical protein